MEDKYIVVNKTGTVFKMAKIGLSFKKGQSMDLCRVLGRSTAELKRDPAIILEISYNNLYVLEEFDSSKKDEDIGNKLEAVLSLLQSGSFPRVESSSQSLDMEELKQMLDDKISSIPVFNNLEKEKKKTDAEEKMRLSAIESLVSRNKKVDKSFKSFGKERKIENESDDFSDILDF